jgi:stage II sporulation protein AB (anti-sigma F factor)
MDNRAKLIIESRTDNLGLARVTTASFASQLDFTVAEIEELKVAISEAISNSIIHGYQEEVGEIIIDMKLEHEQLVLLVEDEGSGIEDSDEAIKASYTTTDNRMGLGLTFIDSFMDNFDIESEENAGTIVTMTKTPERIKKVVE